MNEQRLFLDVGNSSIKAAFKKDADWVSLNPGGVKSAADFTDWLREESGAFEEIVIASVRKDLARALRESLQGYRVRELTVRDIPSYKLDYKTPDTLGIDRYLGCLGASLNSSGGVVVIDGGSACTVDYMSTDGFYRGGVIMPGMDSVVNIFRQKAPELPPVEISIPANFPGKSTQESLQWGQIGFFVDGLNAAIHRYREQFNDFDLYVTGGAAKDIQRLLSEETMYRPYLVFEGMQELLRETESS